MKSPWNQLNSNEIDSMLMLKDQKLTCVEIGLCFLQLLQVVGTETLSLEVRVYF